jgi:glutathione S-transferase
MGLKLYYVAISTPSNTARLMLEYKGLDYKRVDITVGWQQFVLPAHRFRGLTVPALKIDGRRVQGSLPIARALEELKADPSLYPSDPARRAAVEEAEAWGEQELQPVPRNLLRWALVAKPELLAPFVTKHQRLRPAVPMARLQAPLLARVARRTGATDEHVRAEARALPGTLDHVEELLEAGVLGGEQPNAADFQIAPALRVMDGFEDVRPLMAGRLEEYARTICPAFEVRLPKVLPADWRPGRRAPSQQVGA